MRCKMEEWKNSTIDEHYMVSSMGRIKSKDRIYEVARSGTLYKRIFRGKIVNGYDSRQGYYLVTLSKKRRISVHKMIATEFCCGYEDGLCVNHKNGIRKDNRAENLEWVTYSENTRHGFEHNGRVIKGIEIKARCASTGDEEIFSHYRRAKEKGFDFSGIKRAMKNKSQYKGYFWEETNSSSSSLAAFSEYREAQK